jgi:uncharacterized membrane protein
MIRIALALLVLGLMSPPAQAALTLCNRTSYILYAATSAIQSPRSDTEGWTRIAPGECQIARIDGKPDKATGTALADFRKHMHFAVDAGNAELFTVLEGEARKRIAPAGYTVCNDAREPLLVALGQIDKGNAMSQGWWTVQPGACAKALTTPLASDQVYLLAQRKSGGTLVGGPQRFCTTTAAFEIRGNVNCAARGFSEFGFAATRTRGMSGYVAHIGPAGLNRSS